MGDLLTAVPALSALAAAFDSHRRFLAAPSALAPLVELVEGEWAVVDTAPLAPLHPSLEGADTAVNLHGKGPESHRLLLASKPERLLAFAHVRVPETAAGPTWRPREHEVRRWCRLLAESGIPADPEALAVRTPPAEPPPGSRGATLLHVGASSPARRWPPERFAAVAQAEREAGRSVVVTGGADDVEAATAIAGAADLSNDAILAGQTDLSRLAGLVAAAGRVVCGDTGVAHLATALSTPSVVLFGPTSPREWGPPPGRPRHRALWRGRRGDPHASRPDPGLLEVSVEDVVSAVSALPARESSA